LIRKLKLSLKVQDDVDLIQFQSLLFNHTVERLARVWKTRPPGKEDGIYLAEQVLKGKRGFDLWRGPSYATITSFFRLLWQVAQAILSRGRRFS